jgi:hypothetical protein
MPASRPSQRHRPGYQSTELTLGAFILIALAEALGGIEVPEVLRSLDQFLLA